MSKLIPEDEIDFRKLIKRPIRLFGWIYFYLLITLLVGGIFYSKSIDRISLNSIPGSYLDSLNTEHELSTKKGRVVAGIDLNILRNPNSSIIAKGKEIYTSLCESCHGRDGRGDGPAGLAMTPPPRNFSETTNWSNGKSFPALYKTLQLGISENGMAAYEYLPTLERVAVLHYLRTLGEFPEITEEQIQALEQTYSLSQDIRTPNQIPIKKAIKIMIRESIENKKRE